MEARRRRILAFAAIAAVALIAVAWVAALSAPAVPPAQMAIVHETDVPVGEGAQNAVIFPFQLAPDSAAGDDTPVVVTSASISLTIAIPACQTSTPGACPGVEVEVVTSDQVGTLPTAANSTPVWCTNASGTCATTTVGTYGVDLTAYAGQPLDLVVWSPTGTQWVDISADGTWS